MVGQGQVTLLPDPVPGPGWLPRLGKAPRLVFHPFAKRGAFSIYKIYKLVDSSRLVDSNGGDGL